MHLDWKEHDDPSKFLHQQLRRMQNKPHPKIAPKVLYAGDKERLKQERSAQASKFFAYGFGPVSGKNIVIEEVGEVSDDEEDYGDYQAMRMESQVNLKNEKLETDIWKWGQPEGHTEVDEYALARYSKRKK